MKRQYNDIKKKKRKTVVKIADSQIHIEWRHTIEKTLYRFTRNSPLRTIGPLIGQAYYGNFSPFLVDEILRMATPACGIHMALQAIVDTMNDVCNEAANVILQESSTLTTLSTAPVSITLLCETVNIPSITHDQLIANEDLIHTTPLQVRHIVTNDRHRDWLNQYKDANKETVNIFTVRLGPGNTKGSASTGRYVTSVLMPLNTPQYRLQPMHEPYSNTYEDLLQKYSIAMAELTSHQRIMRIKHKEKLTPYEEALIAARKLQHKELEKLRHTVSDQSTHIALITRQNNELHTLINSDAAKDTQSLQKTIVTVTKRLKQWHAKSVSLFCALKEERREHKQLVQSLHAKYGALPVKKQKTADGSIIKTNLTPTTSSYTDDDDDEDEDDYDISQYDSNNESDDESI